MNIVTHKNPHGDELCGVALLGRFGAPGLGAILTVGSDDEANALDRQGNLLVGIGKGNLDEHGKDNQECAATLVARKLKVDELKFFRLLEEVRGCDLEAKARKTHVSELLKILYDHHPEKEVIRWGIHAYEALVRCIDEGISIQPQGIVEEVCVEASGDYMSQGVIARRAWLDCQAAVNDNRKALTELSGVAEHIATIDGIEKAKLWARWGVDALFFRQLDFEKALETVKEGHRFSIPFFKRGMEGRPSVGGSFRGVALYGQNSQLSRAFRSNRAGNLDLLIVRNDDGHVQVFSNAKANVPMVLCIKALRFAEARKRGIKVNIDELGCEDTHSLVPQWFYFAKGGMAMNGSKSHTGIEKTILTDEELLAAVTNAFDPELTLAWMSGKMDRWTNRRDNRLSNPVLKSG